MIPFPQSALLLDIGATKTLVSSTEDLRAGVKEHRFATPTSPLALGRAIEALNLERYDQVVCAFAGGLGPNGLVQSWPNRPEWLKADLVSILESLGNKVTVVDDGVAASIGERSTETENFACVTIGTGIGSGFIPARAVIAKLESPVLTLGHIRTGFDVECSCSAFGCLQAVLSHDLRLRFELGTDRTEDKVRLQRCAEVMADVLLTTSTAKTRFTGGALRTTPRFIKILADQIRSALRHPCEIAFSANPDTSALRGAAVIARHRATVSPQIQLVGTDW